MRLFPAAYCRLSCAAERYVRERFNAVVACVVFLFDFKNLFVYTHNQTSFGVSQSQFLSLIVSLFCVIFLCVRPFMDSCVSVFRCLAEGKIDKGKSGHLVVAFSGVCLYKSCKYHGAYLLLCLWTRFLPDFVISISWLVLLVNNNSKNFKIFKTVYI